MPTRTKPTTTATNRLRAVSHPLRAQALKIFSERTASSAEIARELGEEVQGVSYHVRKLKEFGCIEKVADRQVRGAVETFYRATERHLVETAEWEGLDPEIKRTLVGEYMQQHIDSFVRSAAAGMVGADENFHLTQTNLVLDEEGLVAVLEVTERARLEIEEEHLRSVERRAVSQDPGIHVSSMHGCYKVPPAS